MHKLLKKRNSVFWQIVDKQKKIQKYTFVSIDSGTGSYIKSCESFGQ